MAHLTVEWEGKPISFDTEVMPSGKILPVMAELVHRVHIDPWHLKPGITGLFEAKQYKILAVKGPLFDENTAYNRNPWHDDYDVRHVVTIETRFHLPDGSYHYVCRYMGEPRGKSEPELLDFLTDSELKANW